MVLLQLKQSVNGNNPKYSPLAIARREIQDRRSRGKEFGEKGDDVFISFQRARGVLLRTVYVSERPGRDLEPAIHHLQGSE